MLRFIQIECNEFGFSSFTNGTLQTKEENICDGNPLLTDSSRGRAISIIASSISGMDLLANIDSPQYKAVCWLIFDDARQLDPLTNYSSISLVQRYVLAVLFYSTQGWAWYEMYNFLGEQTECKWNNSSATYGILGIMCDEEDNIVQIDLGKV